MHIAKIFIIIYMCVGNNLATIKVPVDWVHTLNK